jgi:hypothetical protein
MSTHPLKKHTVGAAALAVSMIFIGCASTTKAPPAADAASIRIGSWNIEWLNNANFRSMPARGIRQTPEDLADYIEASGVSVLALQEIVSTGAMIVDATDESYHYPVNGTLLEVASILRDRTGQRWRHTLFPSTRDQNVGVMWNSGAVTLKSTIEGEVVPLDRAAFDDGDELWSRPPRALFFMTGDGLTDFVIIPVHMKSNYGGDFSARRTDEARALAAALPEIARTFNDHDVFIIGDTNSPHHTDESIRAFEDAGLIDLNAGDASTYWRGPSLDRALVPADQPEFASPGFEVFFDGFAGPRGIDLDDFKVRWSDHRMVVFTALIMPDDD